MFISPASVPAVCAAAGTVGSRDRAAADVSRCWSDDTCDNVASYALISAHILCVMPLLGLHVHLSLVDSIVWPLLSVDVLVCVLPLLALRALLVVPGCVAVCGFAVCIARCSRRYTTVVVVRFSAQRVFLQAIILPLPTGRPCAQLPVPLAS